MTGYVRKKQCFIRVHSVAKTRLSAAADRPRCDLQSPASTITGPPGSDLVYCNLSITPIRIHSPGMFHAPISRRQALKKSAAGFGTLALASLLAENGAAAPPGEGTNPLAPRTPHHPARARRIIFLFMSGGPSQVDTFDP